MLCLTADAMALAFLIRLYQQRCSDESGCTYVRTYFSPGSIRACFYFYNQKNELEAQ